MTTKGVWIDDPVKNVLKPAFWDTLVDHGFSTGAIMVERLGGAFDEIYSNETLAKIRGLALARNVELVLTVWPEPNKRWLEEFEQKMPMMLKASGAAGLEFDLEGNWMRKKVDGFPSLDLAGDAFVSAFKRISDAGDVRTEVTTYPFHTENTAAADVAPHADRLLPQAYSVSKRTAGDVAWDSPYGPGRMQKLTMEKAATVPGVGTMSGPMLSCGLAAYEQTFPGHHPEEAMKVAWEEALRHNPIEVRFWSSKWIFGIRSNGYASRFLRSIA